MNTQTVRIVDSSGRLVATAEVCEQDERFSGRADLSAMPLGFRRKFEEFEEIVNGQMFSFLDAIEDQIQALPLKVVFANETQATLDDLQVYPSTGRLSFKVAELLPGAASELDKKLVGR